jgi:hypothetical protein
MGSFPPGLTGRRALIALAADTVNTELPLAESGVTTSGAKEQVIPAGRFEQENDTGASNAPVSELTVRLVLADCPGAIVADDGEAPRNIFLTGVPFPQAGV